MNANHKAYPLCLSGDLEIVEQLANAGSEEDMQEAIKQRVRNWGGEWGGVEGVLGNVGWRRGLQDGGLVREGEWGKGRREGWRGWRGRHARGHENICENLGGGGGEGVGGGASEGFRRRGGRLKVRTTRTQPSISDSKADGGARCSR